MNQNERGLIGSCRHCLSWGDLYGGGVCPSCRGRGGWRVGHCQGCDRRVRVLHGHCRLCRVQAIHELGKMRLRGPVPPGLKLTHWQLFLTGFGQGYELHAAPQAQPGDSHAPTLPVTWQIPGQLALFTCPRDFTRFDRHTHANPSNETLIHARSVARDVAEARGWSHHLVDEIDDALVVLLSAHASGDRFTYTEIGHVDRLGYNVSRTAEVIDHLGLLDDDRVDTTDTWLAGKLAQLASTIADDVQAWADNLRHGGPRTKPRSAATMRNYLGAMLPALMTWLDKPLRGLNVTLKQISMDRQLEEALSHGPDALHLAVVFGIGERTAMRYADAARELLRPELV